MIYLYAQHGTRDRASGGVRGKRRRAMAACCRPLGENGCSGVLWSSLVKHVYQKCVFILSRGGCCFPRVKDLVRRNRCHRQARLRTFVQARVRIGTDGSGDCRNHAPALVRDRDIGGRLILTRLTDGRTDGPEMTKTDRPVRACKIVVFFFCRLNENPPTERNCDRRDENREEETHTKRTHAHASQHQTQPYQEREAFAVGASGAALRRRAARPTDNALVVYLWRW